jgi:sulfate/thiosulfate transport system permease protein
MLIVSFALLFLINLLQRRRRRPHPLSHVPPIRHHRSPADRALLLILGAVAFLGLFLLIPLGLVFVEAFRRGWDVFIASLTDRYALSAIRLTLFAAVIAVPLNTLFGLAAAWLITKFRFKGRALLLSLIDLPFAVSPVIAGLVWVLLFGAQGWWGPWLAETTSRSSSPCPASSWRPMFVTFPFVARELIPLMESQGSDEEEAAVTLGAGGWQIFRRITLPNIKWGLLYGVLLCNARAMGEFGAVSVVSGHIRGKTNTLPLHIEVLYNEYQFSAAFACATLLALLALFTLGIKSILEHVLGHRNSNIRHLIPSFPCPVSIHHHPQVLRQPIGRSTTSRLKSRTVRSPRCSARRAPARPPCCGSSPALISPIPAAGASSSTARTSPTSPPASAASVSCSSTTRSSST